MSVTATQDPDGLSGPSSGGRFDLIENKGRLLLVTPLSHKEGIVTSFSTAAKPTSDAVEADVVVLDGDNAGEVVEGALFFQGGLIGQLRRKIGKARVVGRLDQDPPKKPGYDPMWVIRAPSNDELDTARKWIRENEADPFA